MGGWVGGWACTIGVLYDREYEGKRERKRKERTVYVLMGWNRGRGRIILHFSGI